VTGRVRDPDHQSLDTDIQQIASSAQTDDEALRAWQRGDTAGLGCGNGPSRGARRLRWGRSWHFDSSPSRTGPPPCQLSGPVSV
jgi:hypothetical protein